MSLGNKIRALRELAELSQEQLSALTNGEVSQGAISALEKRNSTTSKHASALAIALKVTLNDLYEQKTYKNSNRLEVLHRVAQQLPDYALDEVINNALKTAELIARAKADKNGTHHQ